VTLAEVKDYLKSVVDCENWYVGKIDNNKECCIGVFPTYGVAPIIPIGGIKYKTYDTKAVSVLVHWGKSYSVAEEKANEVFKVLFGREIEIGENRVVKIDFRTSEPIGIGTDDKGIYEFTINFIIYFKRKQEE